jgi:uncharacterized membrane protein YesL
MKLFSLDTPFGRAVALIADLCILNFYFFVSCLPVFTIGAACAGLYDTAGALLRQECSGITRYYFTSFFRHFGKGTVLFLISAGFGGFMLFDLLCAMNWDSAMALVCLGVIAASAYFYFATVALLPMVLVRDRTKKIPELIKESFLSAIRGLLRTVVAVALNLLPWAMLLFSPALLLNTWMFWFLVGFAVVAYVNSWLLLKVVDRDTWEMLRPVKKNK